MLKQKYFLTDIFILSAEKQPIKLSWRKIEWLRINNIDVGNLTPLDVLCIIYFLLLNSFNTQITFRV